MADFILGRLKFKWKGDWVTATQYIIDDIIKYGGNTYVCIINHSSDADFYVDLDSNAYWSLHTESFAYDSASTAWQATTAYKNNDIVRWGANLYLCNAHHTSATDWATNSAKFTLFVPGLEFEDSYDNTTQYQVGDVVTYGGYTYTANQDSIGNLPTNTTYWEVVTTGFKVRGEYNAGTAYNPGDVVTRHGYVYVAGVDTTGNSPTIQDTDAQSPTYNETITNAAYWTILTTGFQFQGDWSGASTYYLGDVAKETNSSFICTDEHTGDGTSTSPTKPPSAYWDTLAAGDTASNMTTSGDIMIRTSTNTRLGAGPKGWKLRADEGQDTPIHWDPDGESYTWYVDAHKGSDEENLVYSPGVVSTGTMTSGEQTFCTRDLEYVMNAAKYDMIIGSNYMQHIVGHRMNYGVNVTTVDRIRVLGAIDHAKVATLAISSVATKNDIVLEVTQAFDEVVDIINNGLPAADQPSFPAFGASANKQNAVAQMQINKNFIVAEVNAWIEDYIGAMTQAEQDLCTRDLGYVVDAAKYDMAIGTNWMAVNTGIRFNQALYAVSSDKVRVQEAIDHSEAAVIALTNVTGAAETAIVAAYAEIKDLIDNGVGNADVLTFPDFNIGRADWTDRKNGGSQLQLNKDFIASDVNGWVTTNYSTHFSTYDSAKCTRDSGYLVDALTYDLMYGGTSATTLMAKAFFDGGISQLTTAVERNVTVLAYQHMASVVNDIVQETAVTPQTGNSETQDVSGTAATVDEGTICQDLMQIIEDAITANSSAGIPAATYPDVATSTHITPYTDIGTDQVTIIAAAVASVASSAGYVHDASKCTRDSKYFIDALSYDLMYGGDFGTFICAHSFFDGGASQIPVAHRETTGLAYNYMADVLKFVIEEDTSWTPEQLILTQNVSGTPGTSAESTIVDTNLQTIESAVTSNSAPGWASTLPSIANGSVDDTTAFNDIGTDQATIITNAVAAVAAGQIQGSGVSDYAGGTTYPAGSVCRWAPPAWANAGTYILGQMVSHTDTTHPATNKSRWYKCIDATNAGTNAPSTGGTVSAPWILLAPSETINQVSAVDPNNVSVFYGKDRLYGNTDVTTTSNYGGDETMYQIFMAIKERATVTPINDTTGEINEGWELVLNGVKVDVYGQVTGIISWGKNPSAAFKSIRYCMQRSRSGDQVMCAPGVFKEFLPIVIPAGVSLYGKEKRTTFIEPNMEDDGGNGVGISMLGAGRPNNEVAMFYCNDAITVNGFTFRGLTGNVSDVLGQSPPVQPTVKGVCFRLDPNGAINLKSPFIQNAVSINDGGGGIYCDGYDAPYGKYQSFCTNDFTQINSDGFGLFATNKGRIEAVSVFTHYNHVGYLTTNGGIIRSTSGGNSYGEYGSASEGNFETEANLAQKIGNIDNRTGEALPYRVIVDVATGKVIRMEFQYAGEEYTTADVTFSAPGDPDAGTSAVGGAATFARSYSNNGITRITASNNIIDLNRYIGNAQSGTNPAAGFTILCSLASSTTVTPASNTSSLVVGMEVSGTGIPTGATIVTIPDSATFTISAAATITGSSTLTFTTSATVQLTAANTIPANDYIGMTVNILSGTAAGQYGTIRSYDFTTKIATLNGLWTSMTGDPTLIPDLTSQYEVVPTVTLTGGAAPTTAAYLHCQVSTDNEVEEILIVNSGQGYDTTDLPTLAIVDPAADATTLSAYNATLNIADGIPVWSRTSGGGGYPAGMTQGLLTPGTTIASITGDGYAQVAQTGSFMYVKNLHIEPKDGSNIKIGTNPIFYTVTNVIGYTNSGGANGTALIHISPQMTTASSPIHGTSIQFREEYSSCRLTGHDFLSIGTGDFVTSNYPGVPTQAADPTKEVLEGAGGRVFYTATNQDGNFDVGGLFSIQQSSKKATMNVEDFTLVGVQELGLSAGATVNEFSIDGTLSGNSDTALVTEKAIKTYVSDQLGGSESNIGVNTATVGSLFISGTTISTVASSGTDLQLNSDTGKVVFAGEPQSNAAVTTNTSLITKTYFEDNFLTQNLVSVIMETLDNNRVAGTASPDTP